MLGDSVVVNYRWIWCCVVSVHMVLQKKILQEKNSGGYRTKKIRKEEQTKNLSPGNWKACHMWFYKIRLYMLPYVTLHIASGRGFTTLYYRVIKTLLHDNQNLHI
jgi:hypothetical protein